MSQTSSKYEQSGPKAGLKAQKEREQADLSQYVFGKVQPQALPLEEAVLGALMLDREALAFVSDLLRQEMFYLESHQLIYAAIMRLYDASDPVDLLTVTDQLRKSGDIDKVGGPYYLVELSNRVASAANIEYHARIIVQMHIRRMLIQISTTTIKKAYSDESDVFDTMDDTEQQLFKVLSGTISQAIVDSGTAMSNFMKTLEKRSNAADTNEGVTGIPSAIHEINRITAGWQRSDLIVVAARPGMGKTAFVIGEALRAAEGGYPVAIFTLEVDTDAIVQREVVLHTEIPADKFKKGRFTDPEWQTIGQASSYISGLPIYIDDTPGLSLMELRAKCRRLKKDKGIELIIIDYLQLMTNDVKAGNREQEISSIARGVKMLAKELKVPVIALSQLSRAVETRGGSKRPQLSDLRESGAVEQDADIVAFIYRAEYYSILEDDHGESLRGVGEFIISKHRNGALDTAKMGWKDICAKYYNLEDKIFSKRDVPNPATVGGDAGFPSTIPAFAIKRGRLNDEDIPF